MVPDSPVHLAARRTPWPKRRRRAVHRRSRKRHRGGHRREARAARSCASRGPRDMLGLIVDRSRPERRLKPSLRRSGSELGRRRLGPNSCRLPPLRTAAARRACDEPITISEPMCWWRTCTASTLLSASIRLRMSRDRRWMKTRWANSRLHAATDVRSGSAAAWQTATTSPSVAATRTVAFRSAIARPTSVRIAIHAASCRRKRALDGSKCGIA